MLLPEPGRVMDEDAIDEAYAWPAGPWTRANMVATLDGAAYGPDGRSGSISSAADKDLFGRLRALADVIVVGAGTARQEDYGPAKVRPRYRPLRDGRRPAPVIAVVSRTGELNPSARLFTEVLDDLPRVRPLVVTTQENAMRARATLGDRAEIIACGTGDVDLAQMGEVLRGQGLHRLHCEGGPILLGALIGAGLLDELCLTTTPRLLGRSPAPIAMGGMAHDVRLEHLLEDDGTLFARWRLLPAGARRS